jgi:thiosulfate/3-mercaptopyruvate sulfurtransferase
VVVTPEWLHERLQDVVVFDGSWYMPAMNRDIWADFERCRIPVRPTRAVGVGGRRAPDAWGLGQNARLFDIDEVKDATNPLPHMLPPPAVFAAKMGVYGRAARAEARLAA